MELITDWKPLTEVWLCRGVHAKNSLDRKTRIIIITQNETIDGGGRMMHSSLCNNNRYYSIKHLSHRFVCAALSIDRRITRDHRMLRPARRRCGVIKWSSRVTLWSRRVMQGCRRSRRRTLQSFTRQHRHRLTAVLPPRLSVPTWRKRQCMKWAALLWSRDRPT